MKLITFLIITILASYTLNADNNKSSNSIVQKHIEEQMKKEQQYARERAFHQGKDYNLDDTKVDPDTVNSVPLIKPEDDFDMSDVYRDDI